MADCVLFFSYPVNLYVLLSNLPLYCVLAYVFKYIVYYFLVTLDVTFESPGTVCNKVENPTGASNLMSEKSNMKAEASSFVAVDFSS